MTRPDEQKVRTGQIWKRNRDGVRIRILLAVSERDEDWRYETLPQPHERRRTGRIYAWNLRRRYTLEQESPFA